MNFRKKLIKNETFFHQFIFYQSIELDWIQLVLLYVGIAKTKNN